jgi:hypothetical protein
MVGVRVQSLRSILLCGGLGIGLLLSAIVPISAAGTGQPNGGIASLSALSAIADVFRLNGIDPMHVLSPVGVEPLSAAAEPVDSEAAWAAAQDRKLMRMRTGADGKRREVMVLPRPRPQAPGAAVTAAKRPTAVTEAKPAKPPAPQPLADESEGYRRFLNDVIAISKMRLDNPKNLRRAQAMLTSHDELRLARGWLAMCSEIASKSTAGSSRPPQRMVVISRWKPTSPRSRSWSSISAAGIRPAAR